MTRNKLYIFLSVACVIGFLWLSVAYFQRSSEVGESSVCLFKQLTNFPCPSCGSTWLVIALLKGDFLEVLRWNPLGLILLALLIIAPFWILVDIRWKKSSLFDFYNQSEAFLKRRWIAGSAILLVVLNWIWTIYKGI